MRSNGLLALVVGGLIAISPSFAGAAYIFQDGLNGYGATDTYGTHDTEIREGDPTGNYADDDTMTVDGNDGGEVQALLRFAGVFGIGPDQVDYGALIQHATLRLYVADKGNSIQMLRMLQGWDEDVTTWDGFGSDGVTDGNGEASYLRTIEGYPDTGAPLGTSWHFIDIDVTQEVQDWSDDAGGNNFGWAFLPTGNNGVDFRTSEYSDITYRPMLIVDVGEPTTLAVFGLGLIGLGIYRRRRTF